MDDSRLGRPEASQSADDESKATSGLSHSNINNFSNWAGDDQLWRRIFIAEQGYEEDVRRYSERIEEWARALANAPEDFVEKLIFYRVRAGLLDDIKHVLNAQIDQPTSLKDLNRVASKIEKHCQRSARISPPNYGTPQPTAVHDDESDYREDPHRVPKIQSDSLYPTPNRPKFTLRSNKQKKENKQHDHKKQHNNNKHARTSMQQKNSLQVGGHRAPETFEGSQGVKRKTVYAYDEDDLQEYLHARATRKEGKSQSGGRLSEQQKKHRKDNNLCYFCGEPGHMKGECPIAPRQKK